MDPNTLPPLSEFKHSVDVQIRFNDIDILGHLNNTVYFSFYDTGKAYFFEHILGGDIDWRRVESVIANVDCAYMQSIYFGQRLQVRTRCMEIREKSFRLQQVLVDPETETIHSAAETVMVCFDPATKKSKEIPYNYRTALVKSMNN
ncbi:MAG: acyl-CoA thioesterase [Muribaculaceae bacterium]|nr:acyl-CoA thioesterase [Muribaculaceae bacterium]